MKQLIFVEDKVDFDLAATALESSLPVDHISDALALSPGDEVELLLSPNDDRGVHGLDHPLPVGDRALPQSDDEDIPLDINLPGHELTDVLTV